MVRTGGIRIEGDGGTNYELSLISIKATSADGAEKNIFNSIFDNTPGNWREIRKATDAKHSASITVYDSLGYSHNLSVIFTKDTAVQNRWVWQVDVPEPGIVASGGSGSVVFNDDGSLQSFNYDGGVTSLTFEPGTGASNPISIALNPGAENTFDGLTQFEAVSTAVVTDQDGFPMGKLESITFDQSGMVIGVFSNGETQTLAQVSLAQFSNDAGLMRIGNNMYSATNNSGSAVVGEAGVTVDAVITSGALDFPMLTFLKSSQI